MRNQNEDAIQRGRSLASIVRDAVVIGWMVAVIGYYVFDQWRFMIEVVRRLLS